MMLLQYFQTTFIFSIYLYANDYDASDTSSIYISVFLLLLVFIFASYKLFVYYNQSKQKKDINDAKKETSELSFNDSEALLSQSDDLIRFLKNNQNEHKTTEKTYRVQNLLNEVYGLLEPSIQKSHIEFIYDVDTNVPIELVGDSLIIEQILYYLLSHIIALSAHNTITVKFKRHKKNNTLRIQILNSKNVLLKDSTSLDTIHTLLKQIDSTLIVENNVYILQFPFLNNPIYNEAYYTLPSTVNGQKVLLIEDNIETAQTISKTLHRFSLDVTIEPTTILDKTIKFNLYNIVIVNAKLLTPILLRHIEKIKEKQPLYIISLETLFGQRDRRFKPNNLIDKHLYKPLSTGMIFGFLYEIYVVHSVHSEKILPKNKKDKHSEIIFLEETENISRESFQDFNHMHILVVEDNKINQKIIQSVLEKSKITISIANNGQEALDSLNNEDHIDIVLMDINMPIMDGYQTTKKIREYDKFSNLPIIIVSSLGFRNEIEQMYLAGANAHLTKPFKIGQLYNAFKMFFHTDTQDNNTSHRHNAQYLEDINILDTQKGMISAQSIVAYKDNLREILIMYQASDKKIKENIIKKDYSSLYIYCNNLLSDSKHIGATELTQILNEILILLSNKEEALLQNYISLYRDAWLKTQQNIKSYLKSINAY